MKRGKWLVLLLIAASIAIWIIVRWANARSNPAFVPGVGDGRLAECPETPNCVCTQTQSDEHRMDPLPVAGSGSAALQRLKRVVGDMPRTRIVSSKGDYLHIEFRSAIWGFVDDVEFLVDEANKQVHFRSASRVGRSDLGANRRRMEEIRGRYAADGWQ